MDQLVEFRNYTLVPGAADAFVEHFEQHFLASQEALGMDIVGQFTVPGDDARFVWVRRYREPVGRAEALGTFYTSPVWKEFGPRANELMVDVSDVYLLRPDPSSPTFGDDHVPHAERAGRSSDHSGSAVVAAVFDLGDQDAIPEELARAMTDAVRAGEAYGVVEHGRLVTASVVNDFPALPVHEDTTVALWLLAAPDDGAGAVAATDRVSERFPPARRIELRPTARSTIR
jgi:hypothetical protein